jgi:tripartite-type tricarboxylate transporter receptor subunit TctC
MKTMKKFIAALCLSMTACMPGLAAAESYPNKPIRMIVPFGAGSSTDILSRAVAQQLGERLGQPVVVENRAGAGGIVGTGSAARANADGYTFIMGSNGPFAANASLYSDLPYDPIKDFSPVVLIGTVPMILLANNSAPSKNVAQIIEEAKQNPGKLNFGASNTTARVWVELLKDMGGIDVATILYKNVGELMTGLISGQIDYAFENVGPSLPQIDSGKVKALAVTSPERADFAPDVPTMAEAGLVRHELVVWFGLFAPKDTPANIVARVNAEVNELLKTDAIKRTLAQISLKPAGGTSEAFGKYQASETEKWRKLVDLTGIRIN